MNIVGSGCWKTFNFKSMKNSKSSSVKPTSNDETSTQSPIRKESKKGSKYNHKQMSEQSKSLLKPLKSNNKLGSFRESAKGGKGGKGGGVGKGIHIGNDQFVGSNNLKPSTKLDRDSVMMVTNLKRSTSLPLIVNPSLTQNNRVYQLNDSVLTRTTINQIATDDQSDSMFQFFDTNGNGYISEDELIKMMGSLGEPITSTEAKLMIKEADLNRDGKINFMEFRNLLNRLPLMFSSPSTMSLREAFNIFDTDSDGYVNMEEVKLIATAIGVNTNDKNIDLIWDQLHQSTASSSKSKNRAKSLSNERISYDQLKRFFNSIGKK